MTDDLTLRGKWTLRAHGKTRVFVKRSVESGAHVLMKALLWALYLPQYPDVAVEISIGHRYKPDLIAMVDGQPCFWGECGHVGLQKLRTLLTKFRRTHFAFARWATPLRAHDEMIARAMEGVRREAPVELWRFPEDSAERFVDARGNIRLDFAQLEGRRYEG